MLLYVCSIVISVFLLPGCHHEREKKASVGPATRAVKVTEQSKSQPVTGDFIIPGFIKKEVAANHAKLVGQKGDYSSFKKYLDNLDTNKVESIAYAMDYINTCILASDTMSGDSCLLCFHRLFYEVVNNIEDSIMTKYSIVADSILMNAKTKEVNVFSDNMAQCGAGVFASEGGVYLDLLSNYENDNFKNRVTKDVQVYLTLREKELKEGFSEDAGLLISFDELYQRVKELEGFMNKYPKSTWVADAQYSYNEYLSTLLTGMDNSPVFDMETHVLKPEMKKLFQKIIKDDPGGKTTKIVTDFYNLLVKNNFKEDGDAEDKLLKQDSLITMQGVQPSLR